MKWIWCVGLGYLSGCASLPYLNNLQSPDKSNSETTSNPADHTHSETQKGGPSQALSAEDNATQAQELQKKFSMLESRLVEAENEVHKLKQLVSVLQAKKKYRDLQIPMDLPSKDETALSDIESHGVHATSKQKQPHKPAMEAHKEPADTLPSETFEERETFPKKALASLEKAKYFYTQKQYSKAISLLKTFQTQYPNSAESESFLLLLAKSYHADENDMMALETLTRFFTLRTNSPNRQEALYYQGKVFISLGQITNARRALRESMRENGSSDIAKRAMKSLEEIKDY